MSYSDEFYLVRHGDYGHDGRLNTEGREVHAPAARNYLISRGLGSSAMILSSDAPRAAETADIIGQGLGIEPVVSSIINASGNNAWGVPDLDLVVEQALEQAEVEIDGAQDLVVVTHAPMLAIARHVDTRDIKYGEVYTYERNSWNNPFARKK